MLCLKHRLCIGFSGILHSHNAVVSFYPSCVLQSLWPTNTLQVQAVAHITIVGPIIVMFGHHDGSDQVGRSPVHSQVLFQDYVSMVGLSYTSCRLWSITVMMRTFFFCFWFYYSYKLASHLKTNHSLWWKTDRGHRVPITWINVWYTEYCFFLKPIKSQMLFDNLWTHNT